MFWAALFVLFCVGVYAHVDSRIVKMEFAQSVLGEESTISASLVQKMWCRLRYGTKCNQMLVSATKETNLDTIPVEKLLEREIQNLELEIKTDRGAEEGGSYWAM